MNSNYMAQISLWAKWFLPPQEAEDIISDYQDMITTTPRTDEELRRDYGKPRTAVKQLLQPKAYHHWLAIFVVLAACFFIPALCPLSTKLHFLWNNLFYAHFPLYRVFLFLGFVLSLLWFRRSKGKGKSSIRPLVVILMILSAFIAMMWWLLYSINNISCDGSSVTLLLKLSILPLAVASIVGLINARIFDRRWQSVYILSLSALLIALKLLNVLTSLNLSSSPMEWALPTMIELTVLGLAGMGVSLC